MVFDPNIEDRITFLEINGGADAGLFALGAIDYNADGSAAAAIRFVAAPDYEDPRDEGADNEYHFTLVAESGEGESARTESQSVTVTVTNVPIEPPLLTRAFPPLNFSLFDNPVVLTLGDYFASSSGSAGFLSYGTSVEEAGIVNFVIRPGLIILGPLKVGETVVDVIATDTTDIDDRNQPTTTARIHVTVVDPGRTPGAALNLLANREGQNIVLTWQAPVNIADSMLTLARYEAQRRMDGGDYGASRSTSDTTLAFSLPGKGSYQFRVRAVAVPVAGAESNDELGPWVSTNYQDPANRLPVAQGVFAMQRLRQGGDPVMVDLSALFTDPDGDVLTYTATAMRPWVASASVENGSMMRLSPGVVGATMVTITATDPAGLAARRTAAVAVEGAADTDGICGRTPEVQVVIVGFIPGIDDCADVTPAHLAAISETFRIINQGANLTALKSGDFAGLSSITQLFLAQNTHLVTLPEGVFDGLDSLTFFDLGNNRDVRTRTGLTTLPAGLFRGLDRLRELKLDFNELASLPTNLFAGLSNLQKLNLSINELTALPAGVFSGLSSLQELDLRGNDITALPVSLFAGLSDLELLGLRENDLESLPAGIFIGLDSLTSLDLADNPGAPFPLTFALQRSAPDAALTTAPFGLRLALAEGTPFAASVDWSATNAAPASGAASMAAGAADGMSFNVAFSDLDAPLTVTMRNPRFDGSPTVTGISLQVGGPFVIGASDTAGSHTPIFTEAEYRFTLPENQDGGSEPVAVGVARATAAGGGDMDVAYRITDGDTNRFAINPTSGAITYIGAGEDFESDPIDYTLTLEAANGAATAAADGRGCRRYHRLHHQRQRRRRQRRPRLIRDQSRQRRAGLHQCPRL